MRTIYIFSFVLLSTLGIQKIDAQTYYGNNSVEYYYHFQDKIENAYFNYYLNSYERNILLNQLRDIRRQEISFFRDGRISYYERSRLNTMTQRFEHMFYNYSYNGFNTYSYNNYYGGSYYGNNNGYYGNRPYGYSNNHGNHYGNSNQGNHYGNANQGNNNAHINGNQGNRPTNSYGSQGNRPSTQNGNTNSGNYGRRSTAQTQPKASTSIQADEIDSNDRKKVDQAIASRSANARTDAKESIDWKDMK